jgi:hypothetical protein
MASFLGRFGKIKRVLPDLVVIHATRSFEKEINLRDAIPLS